MASRLWRSRPQSFAEMMEGGIRFGQFNLELEEEGVLVLDAAGEPPDRRRLGLAADPRDREADVDGGDLVLGDELMKTLNAVGRDILYPMG